MQLVGATSGFIRRPFLSESVVNGAVAGVIASLIVTAMLYSCRTLDGTIASILDWGTAGLVMGGMVITGMLICLIAALFACNRYLSLSYDELYR